MGMARTESVEKIEDNSEHSTEAAEREPLYLSLSNTDRNDQFGSVESIAAQDSLAGTRLLYTVPR